MSSTIHARSDSRDSGTSKSKQGMRYKILRTLGRGSFSKVKEAVHLLTGEAVAIKVLDKSRICGDEDMARVDREMKILKSLDHPNLVPVYEIFETDKYFFFVMEHASKGELSDYICELECLPENTANKMFMQLISAVEYLHQQGIAHRDIKPSNILLKDNLDVMLIDFGLGNMYQANEHMSTPCGSPCYAAPEVISASSYEPIGVDVWSSGITLFAMIAGYLPFNHDSRRELFKLITSCTYTFPRDFPPLARDLISKILVANPEHRIKIPDIKKHAWFRQFPNNLAAVFGMTPSGYKVAPELLPPAEYTDFELVQLTSNLMNVAVVKLQKMIQDNALNKYTCCFKLLKKKAILKRMLNEHKSMIEVFRLQQMKVPQYIKANMLGANPLFGGRSRSYQPTPLSRDNTLFSTDRETLGPKLAETGSQSSNRVSRTRPQTDNSTDRTSGIADRNQADRKSQRSTSRGSRKFKDYFLKRLQSLSMQESKDQAPGVPPKLDKTAGSSTHYHFPDLEDLTSTLKSQNSSAMAIPSAQLAGPTRTTTAGNQNKKKLFQELAKFGMFRHDAAMQIPQVIPAQPRSTVFGGRTGHTRGVSDKVSIHSQEMIPKSLVDGKPEKQTVPPTALHPRVLHRPISSRPRSVHVTDTSTNAITEKVSQIRQQPEVVLSEAARPTEARKGLSASLRGQFKHLGQAIKGYTGNSESFVPFDAKLQTSMNSEQRQPSPTSDPRNLSNMKQMIRSLLLGGPTATAPSRARNQVFFSNLQKFASQNR